MPAVQIEEVDFASVSGGNEKTSCPTAGGDRRNAPDTMLVERILGDVEGPVGPDGESTNAVKPCLLGEPAVAARSAERSRQSIDRSAHTHPTNLEGVLGQVNGVIRSDGERVHGAERSFVGRAAVTTTWRRQAAGNGGD